MCWVWGFWFGFFFWVWLGLFFFFPPFENGVRLEAQTDCYSAQSWLQVAGSAYRQWAVTMRSWETSAFALIGFFVFVERESVLTSLSAEMPGFGGRIKEDLWWKQHQGEDCAIDGDVTGLTVRC